MEQEIVEKLKELICPPDEIPATGGEQLKTGNRYPNADEIDLLAHVNGEKTYALDVIYKDSSGTEMCTFGVIDIDELRKELALEIATYLETLGLTAVVSYSGRKGYHVYVFSEPVPKELMEQALKKIKDQFQVKGEVIPGDANRCKVAPCLHQQAGNMSYLFREEPHSEDFGLENLPDAFYEEQLEILQNTKPSPANVLVKFATAKAAEKDEDISKDMIPDLSKIEDNLPPCIKNLINNGGSSKLETYDKNNLVLASYCSSKDLTKKEKVNLAQQMAKNSENGPVETTKSYKDKLRHFYNIQKTPSVADEDFNCASILKARRELKFNCDRCKARPKGINISWHRQQNINVEENEELLLEEKLASKLLTYIIQHGKPGEDIAWEIMPLLNLHSKVMAHKKTYFNIFGIFVRALNDGVNSETKLAKWLDKEVTSDNFFSRFFDKETIAEVNEMTKSEKKRILVEIRNKTVSTWQEMQTKIPVKEEKFQEILDRALDLTSRYRIAKNAWKLSQDSRNRNKDIFTASSDFTRESTRILNSTQTGSVVNLAKRSEQLMQYLTGSGNGIVSTPYPVLNDLLGGGMDIGKLYTIVSPPGGGKTTFAAHIADHAAQNEIPVLFISMEMSIEQLFVNSLSRLGEINSAKIMNPYPEVKEKMQEEVEKTASQYFQNVGKYLYIVEGDYSTSPARIEALISMIKGENGLSNEDPLLVVIDYLQLLNTGIEALDLNPNETIKISEIAVKTKQVARDSNVAILGISDVTKEEQKNTYNSKEFTLNSLRGSNKLGHAADTVMALYTESAEEEGGKSKSDPWEIYTEKVKNSENARDFLESVESKKEELTLGGDGATVYARLELLKNRAGQGKGSQFLLYHRAYHKFEPVQLQGQEKTEGRS